MGMKQHGITTTGWPYALHFPKTKTNGYAATWDHHHTIPLYPLHLDKTKTNGYQQLGITTTHTPTPRHCICIRLKLMGTCVAVIPMLLCAH